jgi:hypothetical protein
VGGSCLLFVIAGLFVLKFYEDAMRSRDRGQLVSSIVDQQFHELQAPTESAPLKLVGDPALPALKDESVDLKRWVIQQTLASATSPSELPHRLELIRLNHPHSRDMDRTLERWQKSLESWSREITSGNPSADDLLQEGRVHYFEAAGYAKIGRRYDATVLQLWTISLLTRFVAKKPFDTRVPEALFMLGTEYLDLGPALPVRVRGDRILNLCSELYPDSFWANRSNGVWKEAVSSAI